VGGRAHSIALGGTVADLGASWLHDARRNEFTAMAHAEGLHVAEQEMDWLQQVGSTPIDPARQRELWRDFDALMAEGERRTADGSDEAMAALVPPDHPSRELYAGIFLRWIGAPPELLSAADFGAFEEGDADWLVPDGIGTLLTRIGAALPVRTGAPVRELRREAHGVAVRGPMGELRARAAIVTVPAALIAEEAIRFTPSLPVRVLEAAAGLPLGVVEKAYAQVPPGVLPPEVRTAVTDATRTGASVVLRPDTHDHVLYYVAGDPARALARADDRAAAALVRDAVDATFGSAIREAIGDVVHSGWCVDPWSRGSYSYARPGAVAGRRVLAEPIDDVLWFAGEACSVDAAGTLHGAWRSGTAAARAVLDRLPRAGAA
nr:FAD-dependent oxidoreductase [Gemmatimonadaceae bacterium]